MAGGIYRGISVVAAVDSCEILFDFIKGRQYQFSLYDNGNHVPGSAFGNPLWEKFGITEDTFIPEGFFPPEYASIHQSKKPKLRGLRAVYHPRPTHRIAQCGEEFYAFLKMYLVDVEYYTVAFFNTFVPYEEIYGLIIEPVPYEYRLIDLCELYIETYGCDGDYLNIFSRDAATVAALETEFAKENFQICKCMTDDSEYADVEREFDVFYKKVSKTLISKPNKNFDWNRYNSHE